MDDCGANRNTVHYHVQDMPQLIETTINEDMGKIICEHSSVKFMEECFTAIIDFALKNRDVRNFVRKTSPDNRPGWFLRLSLNENACAHG